MISEMESRKGKPKVNSKWRKPPFFFLSALLLLVIWQHNARFGSESWYKGDVLHYVKLYSEEGTQKQFVCESNLDTEFSSRLNGLFEFRSDVPDIWNFDWKCSSGDEIVKGTFTVFANGSYAWFGDSNVRGEMDAKDR